MQKVYIKKTPFGTFRSDKPLSHGISVFLTCQSAVYYGFSILALCGLLHAVTDPQIHIDRIVFWSVALLLTATLATWGIIVVFKRAKAHERFLQEARLMSLADQANTVYSLQDAQGDIVKYNAANTPADATVDELREAENSAVVELCETVDMDKRSALLKLLIHETQAQLDNAQNDANKKRISEILSIQQAFLLYDRTRRKEKKEPYALLSSMSPTVTMHDSCDDESRRGFTLTLHPADVSFTDHNTPSVVDGYIRVKAISEGRVICEYDYMLPLNGVDSTCELTGYIPKDTEVQFTIEPILLWITESI